MWYREEAYWFNALTALSVAVFGFVAALTRIAPLWLIRWDYLMMAVPIHFLSIQQSLPPIVVLAVGTLASSVVVFIPLILLYEICRVAQHLARPNRS